MFLSSPLKIRYHSLEEEIAFEPGCWLWDYLRRSGASRFLLPLSGGVDSSSVVAIVGCMCQLIVKESSTKWCRYHHLLHIMSELNKPTTFGWCRYSWLDSFGGGLIIVLAAISC